MTKHHKSRKELNEQKGKKFSDADLIRFEQDALYKNTPEYINSLKLNALCKDNPEDIYKWYEIKTLVSFEQYKELLSLDINSLKILLKENPRKAFNFFTENEKKYYYEYNSLPSYFEIELQNTLTIIQAIVGRKYKGKKEKQSIKENQNYVKSFFKTDIIKLNDTLMNKVLRNPENYFTAKDVSILISTDNINNLLFPENLKNIFYFLVHGGAITKNILVETLSEKNPSNCLLFGFIIGKCTAFINLQELIYCNNSEVIRLCNSRIQQTSKLKNIDKEKQLKRNKEAIRKFMNQNAEVIKKEIAKDTRTLFNVFDFILNNIKPELDLTEETFKYKRNDYYDFVRKQYDQVVK